MIQNVHLEQISYFPNTLRNTVVLRTTDIREYFSRIFRNLFVFLGINLLANVDENKDGER